MNPQETGGPVSYNTSMRGGGSKHWLVTLILILLLVASLGFGGWSFTQMQDYKNNSDKKAAAAVEASKKQLTDQLQAQFDEQSKSPNKTYHGSPTYGSITFDYPKTWSGYVDTTSSNEPINGYFNPDIVPGLQSKTAVALRVELLDNDYGQTLHQFDSYITEGHVTARAYIPPKMQNAANVTAGTYLSGQINNQDQSQNGSMVIIKVRDKTLEIYTESNQYLNDFNSVLDSLTFAP